MWCWGEHGRAVHHVPLRGRPRPRRADGRAGQPAVRRGVRRVRRPGNDDGTEGRRVGERHGPAAAPHRSGEVRPDHAQARDDQQPSAVAVVRPRYPPRLRTHRTRPDHHVGLGRYTGDPVHARGLPSGEDAGAGPARRGRVGRDRRAGPGLREAFRRPPRRWRLRVRGRRGGLGRRRPVGGRLVERGCQRERRAERLRRRLVRRFVLGGRRLLMGTATITEWDMAKWRPIAGGKAVTVDFDPQSLELSYTTTGMAAGVQNKPSGTRNKTPAQQSGQSATLSMTLLFDTTTSDGVSVQTRTDPLVGLTLPQDTGEGPPRPVMRFQWGTFLFFGCVESMTQTIDFFSDAGVPLRASVRLSIVEVARPDTRSGAGGPGPSQSFGANAGIGASASFGVGASAGIGTASLTLSQDGDTIQGIVARSGGSVSWKAVATANNIDNPRLLPPGTVLSLNAGAQLSAGLG